jgi:peptide/nickel transport system substrate-binding protein
VRKAIWMALDRDTIIKHIVPGGQQGVALKMMKLCFDHNIGCDGSNNAPKYDPAAAKKLLAEAGYPNGFELTYDVFIPIKYIGEAIAGSLRKVGIKANVNPVTINVFRQKQSAGEINMVSIFYPTAGHPDTGNILDVFFTGKRDYAHDDQMHKLMKAGSAEFDDAKRKAIYKQAMDLNNEKNYVMAFSSLPTNYVHSKDIEIKPNLLSGGDNYIDDYFWK